MTRLDTSKLGDHEFIELATGERVPVRTYEAIRDKVHARCSRYMHAPDANNIVATNEFYSGLERIALYIEEHKLNYDKMEARYGPPTLVSDSNDPWEYSRQFEQQTGLEVTCFTGQRPIRVVAGGHRRPDKIEDEH